MKDIFTTNYGVSVGGDFISFEGKTHDVFLIAFLAVCGMTPEYLKEYKENRKITGPDEFTDKVLYIYQMVRSLKANQRPLTDFSKCEASDYYYLNVTMKEGTIVPGSGIETAQNGLGQGRSVKVRK